MSVNLGSAHGSIVLDSKGVDAGVLAATRSLGALEARSLKAGQAIDKLGTAMGVAGLAMAAGLGLATKSAMDFEATMSGVKAVSSATAAEMTQLTALAKQMGADTVFTSSQAAQGIAELTKAGISTKDVLGGGLKAAMDLASAGAVSITQAAQVASQAMNVFGIEGSQASRVADLFAAAANKSATDVGQLAMSFNQAAAVAKLAGISIEELTGTFALFAQRGMQGSDAGTSLRTALIRLMSPTDKAKETMAQYGLNLFDAQGKMLSLAGIADQLKEKLGGLSDQQRNAALDIIFGVDAIRAASFLYQAGGEGVRKWTAAVSDSGLASRVAAERQNNLKGSLEQLRGSLEAAAISVGNQLIPSVRGAADTLTALINAFERLSPSAQRNAVTVFENVAVLLLLVGATIKTTEAVRTTVTAMTALTNWSVRSKAATTELAAANTALATSVTASGTAMSASAVAASRLLGVLKVLLPLAAAYEAINLVGQVAGFQGNAAKFNNDGEKFARFMNKWQNNFIKYISLEGSAINGYAKALDEWQRMRDQAINRNIAFADAGFKVDVNAVPEDAIVKGGAWKSRQEADAALSGDASGVDRLSTSMERQSAAAKLAASGVGNLAGAATMLAGASQSVYGSMEEANKAMGDAAQMSDTLSKAYFANAESGKQLDEVNKRLAQKGQLQQEFEAIGKAMSEASSRASTYSAALDAVNTKVAQGLPLTADELALLAVAPGKIAATASAMSDLAIARGANLRLQDDLQGSASAAAGALDLYAVSVVALTDKLNALTGAQLQNNSAFGALGKEIGDFKARYDVLQKRLKVLNEKKLGDGLTADEAAELDTITNAMDVLGKKMGELTAKQRDLAVQFAATSTQADIVRQQLSDYQAAVAMIAPAADAARGGLAGLTDGLGNTYTTADAAAKAAEATGGAIQGTGAAAAASAATITTYSNSLGDVPGDVATTVSAPGAVGAGNDVEAFNTALATLPADVAVPVAAPGAAGAGADVEGFNTALIALPADVAIPVTAPGATGAGADVEAFNNALLNLPPSAATAVAAPGAGQATDDVLSLQNAINNTPRSFTVTAYANINPAMEGILSLSNQMPRSPAKEGPFRVLPNWDAVFDIAPAASRGNEELRSGLRMLSQSLDTGLDAAGQAAAKKAAELASSIASATKAATEALTNVSSFRSPDPQRLGALGDSLGVLVRLFVESAGAYGEETLKAGSAYADMAGKSASAVKAGVDALAGLADFTAPAAGDVERFVAALERIVEQLAASGALLGEDGTAAAARTAESSGKIVALVKPGVEALTALATVTGPSDAAIATYGERLLRVLRRLNEIATLLDADGLTDAARFAEGALKIVTLVKPGVEAFTALTEMKPPSDAQMLVFGERLLRIIVRIGEIGNLLEQRGVGDAATFATSASKIVPLMKPGVEALTALTDFKIPSDQQIGVFGERLLVIIRRVIEVAALLDRQGVGAAASISGDAIKVVGLLGAGVDGLSKLADFTAPSDVAIAQFVAAVALTVRKISDAAGQLGGDGVKQAGVYGENSTKAVGLLGAALGAFKDLNKFAPPSAEAIDGLVTVTRFTVDRLVAVATQYNPSTLAQLGTFGDAAGKGFGSLKAALDSGKALADAGKGPSPADAVGAVLGQFEAGVPSLTRLVTVAGTYQTESATIKASMLTAFADLGAALNATRLPNPAQSAAALTLTNGAAATATVTARSEITVRLEMPADDGRFVARSLRVDGRSRGEVADMIADEIAAVGAAA